MSGTGGIRTLTPNQPAARFYRGGTKIAAFRGRAPHGERVPEDWLASTVSVFAEPGVGLSELAEGVLLLSAIEQDPIGWLGPAHVASHGSDPCLLVKLLDAGERLPVHSHPSDAFAAEALGLVHGKAEAWLVLEGGPVHLGFRRDVTESELRRWVEEQDTAALLAAMHLVVLEAGDTMFVPAGIPHAIGEGLFIVELQEPADLSVLLEWKGFDIDGRTTGQLGLGLDGSLPSVDRSAWTLEAVAGLKGGRDSRPALAPGSEPFFGAEWVVVEGSASFPSGFAVIVVVDGRGTIRADDGSRAVVGRGSTLLAPHDAGALHIDGDVELIICRPPRSIAATHPIGAPS